MESSHERIIRHLNHAWCVEVSLVDALGIQAEKTTDPDLRMVFKEHQLQTQLQRDRVEQRLNDFGEKPSKAKGLFTTMLTRMSDLLHMPEDTFDEDAQLLMKSYGVEHLERAMYESLRCEAEAAGDVETARLAFEIRTEEEEAGMKLWHLVGHIARRPLSVSAF